MLHIGSIYSMSRGNENLLEFTNELKKNERPEILEILDRMNKLNAKEKDVIEKCLEIYKDIEVYNSQAHIRDSLEKAFNDMLSKLTWFDIFRVNEYIENNESTIKIIKFIELIENRESQEDVEKLEKMINEFEGSRRAKETFKRKLNLAKKRVERSIGKNIGGLFLTERTRQKITLQELADITGYSASYINRIEKGERKTPTIPMLLSIARALNIDESIVLGIVNKSKEDVQLLSFRDVLYTNEFSMEGQPTTIERKNAISELLTFIINSQDNFGTDSEVRTLVKLARNVVNVKEKPKRVRKKK